MNDRPNVFGLAEPAHWPETIEALQARYPAALAEVHDIESIRLGNVLAPEYQRRHVFDSPDGVRIVVRREQSAGQGEYLHVSAGLDDVSPLTMLTILTACGALHLRDFQHLALVRFSLISGDDSRTLKWRGLSLSGVLHWVRPAWPLGEG